MQRRPLASTAANYPFMQGLHGIPTGLLFILIVPFNLWRGPSETVTMGVVGLGILLCLVAMARIARYYREHYGSVTPYTRRYVRQAIALAAWAAALFGSTVLVAGPATGGVAAAAFAVGILAYSAILFGLPAHHLAVWGTLLVAGLLPVWGGVAVDWGSLPIGVAVMASGILDHRRLVRGFASSERLNPDGVSTTG